MSGIGKVILVGSVATLAATLYATWPSLLRLYFLLGPALRSARELFST